MKRASFTLFQPQRWTSLGQSALMVLFVWCCLGINTASAQIKMPNSAAKVVHTFTAAQCGDADHQIQFTDDGADDGNYADTKARVDTTVICPSDGWSRVTVKFVNTFDLEVNDSLVALQGNNVTAATRGALRIAAGTGNGVSQMNGAWVTASCDPVVNPSGCLTFLFYTDGKNTKGSGWDGWASCAARTAELTLSDIDNPKISCAQITADRAASSMVEIKAPTVKLCGVAATTVQDSVIITVKNQEGMTCLDTTLTATGAANAVTKSFGIGAYSVNYTLKADQAASKQKNTSFTVQAPSLICNDNVEVPFGSACAIQLTPDDLLENPCDTIDGVLSYNITIKIGTGKNAKELKTVGGVYPVIKASDLTAAGMTVCNATASVTVERTIAAAGDCNNGPQNASCTTTLSFNDQSKPFVTLGAGVDTLIACAGDEAALGELVKKTATAIDNCDTEVAIAVKSVVIAESDPCMAGDGNAAKKGETTATITITATDDCGNVGEVTKTVTLIRPNLNDHLVKVKDDTRDCNDANVSSAVPGLQVGTFKDGAFTVTDTVSLSKDKYICGYILTARDVTIPGTDCGKKIYRYWSAIDWCTPEVGPSVIDTNFIEFTDTKAPEFTTEESNQVTAAADIELGPFDCTYDITQHTKPAANDNCGLKEVVLHKVFRIEDGQPWEIEDKADWAKLDCDSFRLMYIARDQCHEQLLEDTTRQIVVIKDVTDPSAICTDELNVSVPNNSGARLHYSDIDAGSYDACGIKKIEIRKINRDADVTSAWGETVTIVCQDVKADVIVEMRVTDNKDNTNTCWMKITAEDKIAPICGNLGTKTYTCDQFVKRELGADTDGKYVALTGDLLALYNSKFGDPIGECSDNLACGTLTIAQEYKLKELTCGALDIDRKWKVTDWSGRVSNEGTQHIDVNYEANWSLKFPVDVDLTCNDGFPVAATAADIITNGSCDLWALEVTEKTFVVPGDICMKVERTYELINWCVYDAGDDAVSVARTADNSPAEVKSSEGNNKNVGRYTYVQVLKLYGGDAPSITVADVDTCLVGEGDLEPFGMADVSYTDGIFECEEERTFTATGMNCADIELGSDNFTWTFTPAGGTAETGTGNSFTRAVAPNTTYTVQFVVSDGCGNSTSGTKAYTFKDCKKPTPYVLHGLAIEIMQTGSIELWASDLNQGSYDNCTVKDKLKYKLFKGDPVDGPQDIEGINALSENVTFTCPVFGLQSVSFYVIDECDNWDVVGTYVSVQTNNGACSSDDMGRIAGKITNALGENVELVDVSVNGGDNTMATGANGAFQFDLALEGDYTITPEKNISPLNGVSTYDLVLISKHILGIQSFDSPYKYIAADVNKSGSITAFDMVQLRQLILNITSEFSNNTSWRFVDAKHEFTSQNPAAENFNEFMNINNLDGQMLDVDFIATKIGDVNGNAQANSLLGAESRTTNGTLSLNVTDRFVEAGQTVTVDFTSADIAATQGYQFTMDFAGLDLVELNEGVAKANNFNTNLAKRGVLTTSWDGEATDENLFSLTFTATTNGLLSELISVNSEITVAEAYNNAGELLDVALNFNSSNVSADFVLNQNTPNPFNGETLIGFNLPQAGIATLKVMDVQGKVLTVISQEGVKGYNQVTVNAKSLGATGVLYYQLESADNIATKKMIIID